MLDYMKQCEADIVNMSMMQRSSSGYEPPAYKFYGQPLLGFVRTKNVDNEKHQDQLPQNTAEATLDLQNYCSLEDNTEVGEDDSEFVSTYDEDGSWHEADPKLGPDERDGSWHQTHLKLGPEERKAARKEHKKKVKEEKREARKTKKSQAKKKRSKKMAKA
jgi:RIO kinase 1